MSFYNSKIIKKDNLKESQTPVHIGDKLYAVEEEYIKKTLKEKKQEILSDIEKLREQKLKEVNEEVESIRQQAFESGRELAKQEALVELKQEMAAKLEEDYNKEMEKAKSKYLAANHYSITQLNYINEKKKEWFEENEQQIVDILMNATEKIIGKAMEMEAQDLKHILNESLTEVSDKSKKVWVRVNPKSKDELENKNYKEENIELIADPELSELDVLIETDGGEWIDSTLGNKLERIKNILEEWVKTNEPLR